MRILVINPNTTASMTRGIANAAERVARAGTTIVAMNPDDGPPAIQGPEDGAAALPGLFALFDREVGSYDAVIIACFDDTGLLELKARSPVPVMGIGEAGYYAAMMLGTRFGVVTTLAVSVPVLEQNIRDYGIGARCAGVRASDIPVLELEGAGAETIARIKAEMARAIAEDNADAIVLGCAGMAELTGVLSDSLNVPVIDGVTAAVGFCEALVNMGSAAPTT